MNIAESLHRLTECIAPQPLLADAPASGRWHALFSDRPRPLLLPAQNRRARRSGVRFFLPQLWRQCYARARLHAHDLFGGRAQLPLLELPASALTEHLDITDSPQLAFLIGTPGPYQKASMLVMSSDGEPLAVVKIAMGSDANAMINAEAYWLRTLHAHAVLEEYVPALLQEGHTRNGCRFLSQSIVKGRPDTDAFTDAHADFLRRLGSVDRKHSTFDAAPIYAVMQESLSRLLPKLSPARAQLFQAAMHECAASLRSWTGPFVITHGDFAFWNIRIDGDRLCVFDWEYAFAGAPPLFDLLHFHLISPAASGRLLGAREMRRALAPAKAFALHAYPEFDWSDKVVGSLGLAYLLHTLLFYGVSRGELVESQPVERSFCRLIEERASWLQ
jgi:hypothetical protein